MTRVRRVQRLPTWTHGVVKIQLSLDTFDGPQNCLIYNEGRTLNYVTEDKDVIGLMRGRSKVYFVAKMVGTIIHIGREVPAEDW